MLTKNYINISALMQALERAGVPQHEAWWLLEKLLNKDHTQLLLTLNLELSDTQVQQLTNWVYQLVQKQQPIQYLLGTVKFLELELFVVPPTLIPRPETEEWCLRAIAELQQMAPKLVLDLCTGTGCIGLAVAQALPAVKVAAVDIAPAACELAERNRQQNKITNFTVYQSDLTQNLPALAYDVWLANPPYITRSEYNALAPNVREWEDAGALVSGIDGLDLIKKIITLAATQQIKLVYLEIGYQQALAVCQLAQIAGYETQVWRDQYDQARVVVCRLA